MSYIKAEQVLPEEIIALIQQYIDGTSIYIPRKSETRQAWGDGTGICEELAVRNQNIYDAFLEGKTTKELAEEFCLSRKSIQRILHDRR